MAVCGDASPGGGEQREDGEGCAEEEKRERGPNVNMMIVKPAEVFPKQIEAREERQRSPRRRRRVDGQSSVFIPLMENHVPERLALTLFRPFFFFGKERLHDIGLKVF